MEAIFVQEGKTIDYTPVSAVTAGSIVVIGSIPAYVGSPIAAGVLGAASVEGVYDVLKGAETYTAGDSVYWDADGTPTGGSTTGCATDNAALGELMGWAVKDAATGDARVRVKFTSAKRTATIAGSVSATAIAGSDSSLGISGLQAAQGGAIPITGGVSTTSANAGGAVSLTGGVPGATGTGGAASVVGGIGGATSGAGGAASLVGGAGSATAGAGGAVAVTGGYGTLVGAGGAIAVTGGAGGATSGNGGAIAIAGGAASANDDDGGAVAINGGAKNGTGDDGAISIGTTTAASVTIAKASIATKIGGPLTLTVGATTTADGSTNADAVALPAATSSVYLVDGADDAKGVILNDADKVVGRVIHILNLVNNKILKIYPTAGATMNGGTHTTVAASTASGGSLTACYVATDTWIAF
jgi:predicted RecA/RadA family phage recombinase